MKNVFGFLRELFVRYSHINWALADQALLSALNFLIGLAFIHFSTKSEYGVYMQLFMVIMLSLGVQRALVNVPLNALAPKKPVEKQRGMINELFLFQCAVSLILALIAYLVLQTTFSFKWTSGLDNKIAITFAAALIGVWGREYFRNLFFLELNPQRALFLDIFYSLLLLCGLAWLYGSGAFAASYVLGLMGTANILSGIWVYKRSGIKLSKKQPVIGKAVSEAWSCGRWSLPGVVVTWMHSNTYVYVAAALLGIGAAAELSAAKLFIMPLALCSTAWSKVFLPRASRWYGEKNKEKMKKVAIRSIFSLSILAIAYLTVLLICYDWLEAHVLAASYKGLAGIVAIWGGLFFVTGIRTVGAQCMISGAKFKELFYFGLISFLLSVPVTIVATWKLGLPGPVVGIISTELILTWLIWSKGWPSMWREGA